MSDTSAPPMDPVLRAMIAGVIAGIGNIPAPSTESDAA